jgi:uncharacterized protein YbbK (DUF523 family)/uncharacterized protein YbgA (DUF1722 family)
LSQDRQPIWPRVILRVSACLIGQAVRYDGGHKRDGFVANTLGRFADYVPVCPEEAAGLGVPRLPIRLVGGPSGPRALVLGDPAADVTAKLEQVAARQVDVLAGIDGYILKSGSPSCGLEGVRVHDAPGRAPQRSGTGVFARILTARLPCLPVQDELGLSDDSLRDSFLTRVFARARWREATAGALHRADLLRFHREHELLALDRSRCARGRLEGVLADLETDDVEAVGDRYLEALMSVLEEPVRREGQVKVMRHLVSRLRGRLGDADRRRLEASVRAFGDGEARLAAPMGLLRQAFRRYRDPHTEYHAYLHPYPDALRPSHGL